MKVKALSALMAVLLMAAANADGVPSLTIDSPVDGQQAGAALIVKFHNDNIRLAPAYAPVGKPVPASLAGLGHLHVYVDGASWHWVHATPDPLVIVGLPAGSHHLKLELAAPNHQVLDQKELTVTVAGGDHAHAP